MENMVSELIEMDKRAQATVKEAEEKRDEMKTAIAKEKEELRQSYLEHAQSRVNKMKQASDNEYAERSAEIDESFRTAAQLLEQAFTAKREEWVKEITARCKRTELSQ